MNFLLFFLYMTLCLVIYGVIGVLLYKIFFTKKSDENSLNFIDLLNPINKELSKKIDNQFWGSISNNDLLDSLEKVNFDNLESEEDSHDFLKKVR